MFADLDMQVSQLFKNFESSYELLPLWLSEFVDLKWVLDNWKWTTGLLQTALKCLKIFQSRTEAKHPATFLKLLASLLRQVSGGQRSSVYL